MAWVYLLIAGILEVAGTSVYRYTEDFTKPAWCALFIGVAAASMLTLRVALFTIPLGTGYAVWTGIGAAGTALVGLLYFGEPATTLRLVFLTTLIGSIIGLKIVSLH